VIFILQPARADVVYFKSPEQFDQHVLESESVWLLSISPSSREVQHLEEAYSGIFKVGYVDKALFNKITNVSNKTLLFLIILFSLVT